jgi:hypothetical protein
MHRDGVDCPKIIERKRFLMPMSLPPRHGVAALIVALLLAGGMVYYQIGLLVPNTVEAHTARGFGAFGKDFYPIWLTTREALLHHRDPYAAEMTRQIQTDLFGHSLEAGNPGDPPPDYRAFSYPAIADILFWPLALLPFAVVRVMLGVLLPLLTACSLVLWLRALRLAASPIAMSILVILTLSSYPVLEGWFAGQPGILVGFLLAASLAALVTDRLFVAGTLLALTAIKPQMCALIVLYLLIWSLAGWRKRWPFACGLLGTLGLLLGTSLLVWPHWLLQWLEILLGYRHYSTPPLVADLLGPQLARVLGPLLITALLGAAVTLAWRMRHAAFPSSEFALTVSLLLAITVVTLLPGHAMYDRVVLLPGILLIAFRWHDFARRPAFRIVLLVTAAALFWQWFFALVLLAVRPLLSPEQFFSSAVFSLPIRTAGAFPFGVLGLLALMLRGECSGDGTPRTGERG